MHATTNGVSSPANSVNPIKEAGGFRISLLAKGILAGLTILSMGAAIASAVLFFHLCISIALDLLRNWLCLEKLDLLSKFIDKF